MLKAESRVEISMFGYMPAAVAASKLTMKQEEDRNAINSFGASTAQKLKIEKRLYQLLAPMSRDAPLEYSRALDEQSKLGKSQMHRNQ